MWLWLLGLMVMVMQVQMQPVDKLEAHLPEDEDSSEGGMRALYDQRQTGKYNIHVSIKDVAIIEVDQNELADESYNAEDDDYYYDDSALTIRPIKFTTATPSTTITTTTTAATPTPTSPPPITTPTTTTGMPTTISSATVATPSSGKISAYSAQLLADIAATQRQKPKTNNLIIMDTPPDSPSTLPPKWVHARSKDEPITTTLPSSNIEYTPAQGHDSPIFKVKVQRAANAASVTPTRSSPDSATRCRPHQFRDGQGRCHSKRSGSILRKLFSMLVSLPFGGNRRSAHGHGLQVSPP